MDVINSSVINYNDLLSIILTVLLEYIDKIYHLVKNLTGFWKPVKPPSPRTAIGYRHIFNKISHP